MSRRSLYLALAAAFALAVLAFLGFPALASSVNNPGGGSSGPTTTYTVHASSTGTTTIDATATVWPCDTTSGSFTITLPTSVGISGRAYIIKKTNSGGGTVTIGTTSSQTVDGATTQTLLTQYASYSVVSDGANWLVY